MTKIYDFKSHDELSDALVKSVMEQFKKEITDISLEDINRYLNTTYQENKWLWQDSGIEQGF